MNSPLDRTAGRARTATPAQARSSQRNSIAPQRTACSAQARTACLPGVKAGFEAACRPRFALPDLPPRKRLLCHVRGGGSALSIPRPGSRYPVMNEEYAAPLPHLLRS